MALQYSLQQVQQMNNGQEYVYVNPVNPLEGREKGVCVCVL